jgi:aminoglycoside phosphotransferase family enzyme/predicted kinase
MEPQRETIEFLSAPHAHGGVPVERVDTHASIVFLAGETAYKLKRAVRYDYLDFSTAERRKAMSEAELAINRRTAPQIYRRVVPVTRDELGALAIDGTGTPVDWLLVMRRFDQGQLLARLAASGGLSLDTMTALGHAIVHMHDGAERCAARGGAASLAWVVDGNARDFAARPSLDGGLATELTTRARAALAMHAARLDDRQGRGFVRRCHGDLHLRNIVLLDGAPTPFDAVEFNDDISCIDVLYDLAFLLMDLWRRSLRAHANAVFNTYVGDTGHVEGLALLPLFLSCRAAVRAKTGATTAALESDPVKRRELEQTAAGYLALARQLLEPPPARLVAVGGLSGTGKSSLARRLAPLVGAAPGALVVRSDELRKRRAGVPLQSPLPPASYTADASARVYESLVHTAERAVAEGHTVIADAVFSAAWERDAIEAGARRAGVPFLGIWLEAPADVCVQRVANRRGDASDADTGVVHSQFARETGPIGWMRLDASGDTGGIAEAALRFLGPEAR